VPGIPFFRVLLHDHRPEEVNIQRAEERGIVNMHTVNGR
jgi:hypothetical protein